MTQKKKTKKKSEQALQTKEKRRECVDCEIGYSEVEWQEWFTRWEPPLQPPYYYQCEFCLEDEERSDCQECGDYVEGLKLCSCCSLRILCDRCREELDDYDWIL